MRLRLRLGLVETIGDVAWNQKHVFGMAMIRRRQDLRATNTDIRSFDQDTRNDGESLSMSLRNL